VLCFLLTGAAVAALAAGAEDLSRVARVAAGVAAAVPLSKEPSQKGRAQPEHREMGTLSWAVIAQAAALVPLGFFFLREIVRLVRMQKEQQEEEGKTGFVLDLLNNRIAFLVGLEILAIVAFVCIIYCVYIGLSQNQKKKIVNIFDLDKQENRMIERQNILKRLRFSLKTTSNLALKRGENMVQLMRKYTKFNKLLSHGVYNQVKLTLILALFEVYVHT